MTSTGTSSARTVVVIPPVPPGLHAALTSAGLTVEEDSSTRVIYRPTAPPLARHEPDAVPPMLFTPSAAAAILGVSRSTLYSLLAEGRIQSVKIGALRRISRAALERYVRQLEVGAVG